MKKIDEEKEMFVFKTDLNVRKTNLHCIVNENINWRIRIGISYFLLVCSINILVLTGIMLYRHPTTTFGVLVFVCCGIIFSCIPFFISRSVKNKANYKCAFPFSSYANGILTLYENHLKYEFWCVGPHEPAAYSSPRADFHQNNKFVFLIKKSDISSLTINEKDICNIKGVGSLIPPKWAEYNTTEVQEVANDFSFLMAFQQNENAIQAVLDWKDN